MESFNRRFEYNRLKILTNNPKSFYNEREDRVGRVASLRSVGSAICCGCDDAYCATYSHAEPAGAEPCLYRRECLLVWAWPPPLPLPPAAAAAIAAAALLRCTARCTAAMCLFVCRRVCSERVAGAVTWLQCEFFFSFLFVRMFSFVFLVPVLVAFFLITSYFA